MAKKDLPFDFAWYAQTVLRQNTFFKRADTSFIGTLRLINLNTARISDRMPTLAVTLCVNTRFIPETVKKSLKLLRAPERRRDSCASC